MLFPLPGRSSNPAECCFQQGISSSSSSSIKLCESRVYVNAGPLLTTASGKASAILKAGVVKCFGSPVEQKMSKINAVIYNTCMPSTNFYSSLELSTCRRFAFFSLGYLTVLFLPFTAPGASWSLKALSHACSQGAMPKALLLSHLLQGSVPSCMVPSFWHGFQPLLQHSFPAAGFTATVPVNNFNWNLDITSDAFGSGFVSLV